MQYVDPSGHYCVSADGRYSHPGACSSPTSTYIPDEVYYNRNKSQNNVSNKSTSSYSSGSSSSSGSGSSSPSNNSQSDSPKDLERKRDDGDSKQDLTFFDRNGNGIADWLEEETDDEWVYSGSGWDHVSTLEGVVHGPTAREVRMKYDTTAAYAEDPSRFYTESGTPDSEIFNKAAEYIRQADVSSYSSSKDKPVKVASAPPGCTGADTCSKLLEDMENLTEEGRILFGALKAQGEQYSDRQTYDILLALVYNQGEISEADLDRILGEGNYLSKKTVDERNFFIALFLPEVTTVDMYELTYRNTLTGNSYFQLNYEMTAAQIDAGIASTLFYNPIRPSSSPGGKKSTNTTEQPKAKDGNEKGDNPSDTQSEGNGGNKNNTFGPNTVGAAEKYVPTNIQKVDDKFLKRNGIDAHQLKDDVVGGKISRYDIYVDKNTGQLWVYSKGGKGEGIPTGEYIK